MKKLFSILLTFALLLSLVSVVSLADTAATQRSVPLLGVVVDGATETQELPADGMGGVNIPGTGGWKAWVSYWTDEVAEFAPEAGEKLYLVYDMTVAAGTNVQFTISGWNNPISKELAGAAAELGEGGVYSIPGGTYSGALELDRARIGDNGRIGVLGNGIEIRTCALVCTAGTPETPDPAPSKAPTEPPAPKEVAESAGIDLISVITNGSDESDTTEITDSGSGFVISQPKAWNVWVMNYAAEAAEFEAAAGENLYLVYDFTTSGDVHLCLNGWNNSVAADIAAAAGAKTASAEDGTPMLKAGTYVGAIEVTKDMIGENGRFGLRGLSSADATIRTFRLVSGTETESTGTKSSSATTKPSSTPTTKPTEGEPVVTNEIDLIKVIVNGADDVTEAAKDGSTFTISQTAAWVPWVMYYTDEAVQYTPAAGETLYLAYDFTANGDVHLCLNGWNNSVAAAIAKASGGSTVAGEDGAVLLKAGTYQGKIEITKDMIGEDGRFGIVGSGATIRKFQLVTANGDTPSTDPTTKPTTKPTTAPTTKPSQPAVMKGDANGDNAVNMKDVLVIRKYIAGLTEELDLTASDVNNDGAVNMKDVLLIRKYIAGLISGFDEGDVDPTDPSATDPSETEPQGEPVTGELDLIEVITNGSDETDGTEIKDEGNGFVITQSKDWNVWVLYFNENAPLFYAREGENVFLEYDMSLTGDAHLNVNGWNNSIAAMIAKESGMETTFAEDGTPMLTQGSYKGRVQIDPSLFGETGRLGIVGKGATIRTFKLVSAEGGVATTAPSKQTTNPTETVPSKTTPPTQSGTPYITYNTSEKFGSLGTWWWNANQISNESQRKQRLDLLQQNHVTEIYLCVTSQSFEDLADFVIDAGSRGMRVAWLAGDVSWVESGNTGFDGAFARFKNYQNQAPANAKFYGVHFDVEPQAAGRSANWQGFADLVLRATKAAHDYGTIIEWDIAFWLDGTTVKVNNQSVRLLDVLAENSDTLTLMSYRDTADAVLSISAEEIPLGSKYNCKIILGFESNYTAEGANLSFAEEGKAAMYSVVQSVLTSLSQKDTLSAGYGCAIHYVDTWLNLKN